MAQEPQCFINHPTSINPERRVVSLVNCHTSKISKLFDHNLQPHGQALPSYVKDSKNFIEKD